MFLEHSLFGFGLFSSQSCLSQSPELSAVFLWVLTAQRLKQELSF